MGFTLQKKTKYSRLEVYQTATGTDGSPDYNMGQTGYDIKSFNIDGTDRFIEVKTTKQGLDTEFFMSPNEIEFSELNNQNYSLYRVYDLRLDPLTGSLYIYDGDILNGFDKEATEFRLRSK